MTDMQDKPDATVPDSPAEYIRPTPRQIMMARFRKHYGFQFGLLVLGAIVLMAVLAPLLAPYDP